MDRQSHWQIVQSRIEQYTKGFRPLSPVMARHALDEIATVAFREGEHYALSSLLTIQEAAPMLHVSERRVRALARARSAGWQISGGVWLFRPEDIERMRPGKVGCPPKKISPHS